MSFKLGLFYTRRTVYFGQLPGDSDLLQIQSNVQKALGRALFDIFGTSNPQFTGLTVTPGSGFSVNIGAGSLYQQIAAEATAWGSPTTGLPIDATVITKQGRSDSALSNQFGTMVAPGSGTNYYTLECQVVDSDSNPNNLTFSDTQNNRSSQTQNRDRVTGIAFALKGPNTSSPPPPDSGWFSLATFAIPSGASSMQAGYITQGAAFAGFASILTSGSFVILSPGSQQSGFINISGNLTCASTTISGTMTAGQVSAPTIQRSGSGPSIAIGSTNASGITVTGPSTSIPGMLLVQNSSALVVFQADGSGGVQASPGGAGLGTPAHLPPTYTPAGADFGATTHLVTGTLKIAGSTTSSVILSGAAVFTSATSFSATVAADALLTPANDPEAYCAGASAISIRNNDSSSHNFQYMALGK